MEWVSDTPIPGGSRDCRPDLYTVLEFRVLEFLRLMVEVDERQHRRIPRRDESELITLSEDNDHGPMVVLRFNPDDYQGYLSC